MNTSHPFTQPHLNLAPLPECESNLNECPAERVLRLLTGKWKPQILRLASQSTIRFNSILRKIPGSNKQSLSVALKELEDAAILEKNIINERPLHIEYKLTEKGRAMMPIFSLAAMVARTNT